MHQFCVFEEAQLGEQQCILVVVWVLVMAYDTCVSLQKTNIAKPYIDTLTVHT